MSLSRTLSEVETEGDNSTETRELENWKLTPIKPTSAQVRDQSHYHSQRNLHLKTPLAVFSLQTN